MSAGGKAKLKQIQKHIKAEEWESAVGLSKEVLKEEKGAGPNVYNALVFAGLALTKLDKNDEAEKALLQATKLSPELPLAFQGLIKLHTDGQEWDKLSLVLQGLVNRGVVNQDAEESEKWLGRLIQVKQEHGTEPELLSLLTLLLPSSPIYNLLFSLPPPANASTSTYTPLPLPSFSSPTLSPSALPNPPSPPPALTLPSPLPSPAYLVHNSEISLALLVSLTVGEERVERAQEEKEVEVRRKRLGAGPERMVRKAVGLEVLGGSKLPGLYEEILAHPSASDEIRRAADSKLLRHWWRLMLCLSRSATSTALEAPTSTNAEVDIFAPQPPPVVPTKEEVRGKIQEMVKGMVLLEVPDEGGWSIRLEWMDVLSMDEYPIPFLHSYVTLFPSSTVSSLLLGYLRYYSLPLPSSSSSADAGPSKPKKLSRKERLQRRADEWRKANPGLEVDESALEAKDQELGDDELLERAQVGAGREIDELRREPFSVLVSGLEENPRSLLAHRILADIYLKEEDYANAIATAEKGKEILKAMSIETGLSLAGSSCALDIVLGTALVHYYPPKHHARALKLLDGVLEQQSGNIPSVMGRGYIFESQGLFAEARAEFQKGIVLAASNPGNWSDEAMECQEEAGWCYVEEGQLDEGKHRLEEVVITLDSKNNKALQAARCWWRIGQATWRMGADHREEAHSHFVTTLRRYPTYASAFTSIGIYYLEAVSPPDTDRAQKCFQKAFELDATQGEAARRLVIGLAAEKEWALVDVIAKRVIAGEGGIDGGLSAASKEAGDASRFLPKNSWAWKAVGAVEMSYRKYPSAASAFQIALRADPDDAALWMRLGEAYAKAGRHVASLKALHTCLGLDSQNWLCLYYIGDTRYQLGLFAEALVAFEAILKISPDQPGVVLRIAESQLALGKVQKAGGFRARALQSLRSALHEVAKTLIGIKEYRLAGWKIVGDTIVELFDCLRDEEDILSALDSITPILQYLDDVDEEGRSSVPGVTSTAELLASDPTQINVLKSAICAYAYRADLLKFDTKVPEPPLHDLAAALHLLVSHLPATAASSDATEACVKAAVLAIKRALDSDPGSASLWNDFGTVAVRASAQLAQHAFIVALELEPRNPIVWTNLGFLALQAEDLEVANQSFLKAQISDPEYALCWLGQALVATHNQQLEHAQALFEQAATLSTGSLLSSNLGYSNLLFQPFLISTRPSTSDLHQPAFALERFTSQFPASSGALLLRALICERLNQYEVAEQALEKAVGVLELEYEARESTEVEERYAIALVNLGRIRLANGKATEAIATFDDCAGLVGNSLSEHAAQITVQCRLGCALGYSAGGDVDAALSAFQDSLIACDRLGQGKALAFKEEISIMLSRALWEVGGGDAREAAKGHLLECFDQPNHSAAAMSTLAAIGVLTDDDGLVDIVSEEIKGLSSEQRADLDESHLMDEVRALSDFDKGRVGEAIRALSSSVHQNPHRSVLRGELALGLLETNQTTEAKAILSTQRQVTDYTEGDVDTLSRVTALSERSVQMAQAAVRAAPWRIENWQVLGLLRIA